MNRLLQVERHTHQNVAPLTAAILILAPAVAMVGHVYHPWIGNPGDPGFFERLAEAVAADPTRWWLSHFLVGIGSGLVAIAFLALRTHLREFAGATWSGVGLPFVVMGSVLFAMLPAMEFTPVAAHRIGADVAAAQAALMPLFHPILLSAAFLFALGVLGFAIDLHHTRMPGPALSRLVLAALLVMAASRFFPVGAAQLYVGPAAGLVALWTLAFAKWKQPSI
jgi:hypothetical protein